MSSGPRCLFNVGKDQWTTQQTDLARAHGAQEETGTEPRGLFSRLFDAFSPDEVEGQSERLGRTLPGLANLQRLRVEDVAVPKAEIVALSVDTDLKDIVQEFRNSGYSRIPVYEDTLRQSPGPASAKGSCATLWVQRDINDLELHRCWLPDPCMFRHPRLLSDDAVPFCCARCRREGPHRIWRWLSTNMAAWNGRRHEITKTCLEQVVGEIEDEHDTDKNRSHHPRRG